MVIVLKVFGCGHRVRRFLGVVIVLEGFLGVVIVLEGFWVWS